MFRTWTRILLLTLMFVILFLWNLRLEYEVYETRMKMREHVDQSVVKLKQMQGGIDQIDKDIQELIDLWKKHKKEGQTEGHQR